MDDLAVGHDGSLAGHTEGNFGELLDDEDGHSLGGDLGYPGVELLDDQRGQADGELVEDEQRRIGQARPRARASICCSPPESVPAV